MLQVPLTNIHHITMFTICELRTSHFRFAPSFSISHIQIQFENMFYKYTIVKSQNICKHIIWSEKWKNNWCKISYLYRTWCLSSCHSPSPGKPTYSTSAIWLIQAGPFSRAVCCLIPTMFVNPTLWFFFRTQNWQEMEFNVFCATIVIIQLDFETQRVIFMIFHQIILFKFQAFQYGIYVLQWFANGNNIKTITCQCFEKFHGGQWLSEEEDMEWMLYQEIYPSYCCLLLLNYQLLYCMWYLEMFILIKEGNIIVIKRWESSEVWIQCLEE